MTKSENQRLHYFIDKQEILELINRYCQAADRHDPEALRALYHTDALDDHGAFFKGLAMDFIDKLPEIQAPMEILHHNVTTVNIEIDGDYAEGEVYILAFHKAAGPDGSIDVLIGGRYFDKYEKRDGKWKFAHRAVVADWVHIQDPSAVNLEHPFIAGSHIGRPGADDPSYTFFKLITRQTP
tara:strand:- start:8486 stop:9031 length:546 start_codon:yes stop_codon:yes gene_type:complete